MPTAGPPRANSAVQSPNTSVEAERSGTGASPADNPATANERVALLDVLRGLALFGILVINLGDFSLYWAHSAESKAALPTAALDPLADGLRVFLFEGKFYSIFSLLFGIGFAMQLMRGDGRPAAFLSRFRRRLLVLMGIGVVHLTLFWQGDILFLYALTGFLLLPFRDRANRTLLVWAAALVVLPVLIQMVIALTGGALDPGAPFRTLAGRVDSIFGWTDDTDYLALLRDGGWRDFLAFNAPGPLYRFAQLLGTSRLPKVLAMFLVGFWVGRNLHLGALQLHRPLLRRVLVWGLVIGVPANAAMAYLAVTEHAWKPTAGGVLHAAAYALGVAPLGLAYAAAVALVYLRPVWAPRLEAFAPVGRMALTSYLMQTAICVGLFYGVGLGWGGRFGPALFPLVALAIFAAQTAASAWWLARFRFGPVEWLWRTLTYGRRQPMRCAAAAVTVGAERSPLG